MRCDLVVGVHRNTYNFFIFRKGHEHENTTLYRYIRNKRNVLPDAEMVNAICCGQTPLLRIRRPLPKRKGIRVDDRNQEVGKHQGMTIRSLREEAGLTKQDVIDASGLSSRIVYRLEEDGYDIRSISAEKLMRLAYILDTDPMCLYEAGLPKK